MKRYTKGLITGILLTASALPLIAQEDASGLTLEKDGEQVLIPLGEWVAVSSAYDPSNMVRGIYLGMTVDALRIQEKGKSFEQEIPMDEIGSIFRGKTKSTRYYVFQGIIVAGIGTLGFGVMEYLRHLSDDRNDPDDARSPASFAYVFRWLLFPGMFTIPAGALIGFSRAKAAEGKAVEYVIGDGEWKISNGTINVDISNHPSPTDILNYFFKDKDYQYETDINNGTLLLFNDKTEILLSEGNPTEE